MDKQYNMSEVYMIVKEACNEVNRETFGKRADLPIELKAVLNSHADAILTCVMKNLYKKEK